MAFSGTLTVFQDRTFKSKNKLLDHIGIKGKTISQKLASLFSVKNNNSNTTFCSEFSVFLNPFSVNCDGRKLSVTNAHVNTCAVKCKYFPCIILSSSYACCGYWPDKIHILFVMTARLKGDFKHLSRINRP